MIGIYKITNKINGKAYIGQSIDIKRRWREHKNNIGLNKNPLYLDFKNYGIDNFSFEVLEKCNLDKLDEREIYWIEFYDTYNNGYNLTRGGQFQHSSILINFPSGISNFIADNSMHLFYCLFNNSYKTENGYFFMQNNFSINKIHELLGMHSETIKKYWKLLEDNKLIQYQGPQDFEDKFLSQQEWNKKFMARKKYSSGFYKIPKGELYRIIPRETVDKLQNVFLVDEIELKLYLLLANMQEHFCYMKSPERLFTLQDLRELLKMSKKVDNNKKIILSLCWLEKLNLIEYSLFEDVTNLGTKKYVFNLISVNYYTDGGQIENMLSSAEDSKLTSEMKEKILTEQVVYFEE